MAIDSMQPRWTSGSSCRFMNSQTRSPAFRPLTIEDALLRQDEGEAPVLGRVDLVEAVLHAGAHQDGVGQEEIGDLRRLTRVERGARLHQLGDRAPSWASSVRRQVLLTVA